MRFASSFLSLLYRCLEAHWFMALCHIGQRDIGSWGISRPCAASELPQLRAKLFTKYARSFGRDRDRARPIDPAYPPKREAVRAECCTDCACQMRASFAPIETGPAQDTAGAFAPTRQERVDVDADPPKECDSWISHDAAIVCQLRVSTRHQCVRKSNTKPASEMVVAGPRNSKGGVSRAHREPWLRGFESDATCMIVSIICATLGEASR